MRVFVTGGTGWVGQVVVDDLIAGGHRVAALARSEDAAALLSGKGAEVVRGTLDDLGTIAAAAGASDAVMHLAFNHDFATFSQNVEQEREAIEAMGSVLAGTDRPFLYTSGLAFLAPGRIAAEADMPPVFDLGFPRKNEVAAVALAEREVRVGAVRLAPTVHGIGDRMFMAALAKLAHETGVSAYVGDGENRWPAVHVADAGRLYRLIIDTGASERAYHANAEEGVPFRHIAEAIGRNLGLPVEPRPSDHFGWLAAFAVADAPASSARTREITGWMPEGPTLLSNLADPDYFKRA